MAEIISDLINNLIFILERLDWLGVIDLVLVTAIFFLILRWLRDTQALVLLRGVFLLIALISLLTSLEVLPAFSWLMRTTLPALLLAIPVIFAPEIRRALERLGRAGAILDGSRTTPTASGNIQDSIGAVVNATTRLADRRHGALIVLGGYDNLQEYIQTGVRMEARITAELLLQVFYPNTPLHDGAAIILGSRLAAASCVLPLSSSGVLSRSPERQMGLRHRAALGISEVSDAVAVVVSEETGSISVVHAGRMIRRLDAERLDNILRALYKPERADKGLRGFMARLFPGFTPGRRKED
ncbi:MAG TPA: diadenylate cyclase CdaA [Anaerolineales bacterium]|nr:diadenylate cyclase CdaA [Anaerolineales bacterium]